MISQTLEIQNKDSIDLAILYYRTLFSLNNIHIRPRELELISFTAVRGTLSTPPIREEFMELYKINKSHLHYLIHQLNKKGILIKKEGKWRVNPKIHPDFSQSIRLTINLKNGSIK